MNNFYVEIEFEHPETHLKYDKLADIPDDILVESAIEYFDRYNDIKLDGKLNSVWNFLSEYGIWDYLDINNLEFTEIVKQHYLNSSQYEQDYENWVEEYKEDVEEDDIFIDDFEDEFEEE